MNLTLDLDGSIHLTKEQFLGIVHKVRVRNFKRVTEADGLILENDLVTLYHGTSFHVQGNFTGVVICFDNLGHIVGMTRKSKRDINNPVLARMLAMNRAIQSALRALLKMRGFKLLPKDGKYEEAKDQPAVLITPAPVKDIPRTMEAVANAIVYPVGSGG